MMRCWPPMIAVAVLAWLAPASAQELSSSIMRPTVVDPASAAVQGPLPGAGGAKTYYLALDLKAGSLTTQLQLAGPSNGTRRLTLQLLDAASAVADQVSVRAGFGTKDETTKSFAIDNSGRHVVRLTVEGEENGTFCVLLGGTALPTATAQNCGPPAAARVPAAPRPAEQSAPRPSEQATPRPAEQTASRAAEQAAPSVAEQAAPAVSAAPAAAGSELSTSVLRPTPIDQATGMLAGTLPGGGGDQSYYVSADLKAGNLLTQAQITGRANGERRLTFARLDAKAAIADQAVVRAGFGTKDEVTKVFAIDASGRHVFRLTISGEETGTYCLLFGGTAMPDAKPADCPAPARSAALPAERNAPSPAGDRQERQAVVAPPPPKAVEVIVSKCEERLRVGSDFLFDFDRAELRPEAVLALDQLAQRIAATDQTVTVEGHTDAKGTDAYNNVLSERRATSVRDALIERGLRPRQLAVRGYGKTRAVAPNQNPDGSDNPDGRQKNRRVEVVVDTCK